MADEINLRTLTSTLEDLKIGQDEIHLHLIRIDGRLDRTEGRLGHVEIRLDRVDSRLDRVEGRLGKVEARLGKLEVGQEELLDRVQQIAEGHAVTQAAITRSTAEIIEHIDKKIVPLETAVRVHFGS